MLDDIIENENRSLNKISVENITHFVKKNSTKLEHFKQVFFNLSSVDSTPDKVLEAIEMILIFNSNLVILAFDENRKSLLLEMLSKYENVIILYEYIEEDIKAILKGKYVKQNQMIEVLREDRKNENIQALKENVKDRVKNEQRESFLKRKNKTTEEEPIKAELVENKLIEFISKSKMEETDEQKKQIDTHVEAVKSLKEAKEIQKTNFLKPVIIIQEKIIIRPKEKVKIAVCGTQSRIGTTTQSLLITQYLKQQGMYTCYVEACKNKQIETISSVYTVVENTETGLISLPGLDIYHKQKLAYLMGLNIDFYVFDYGLFSDIELETFLLSDIKIIVMGVKPWEMEQTAEVLKALKESIDCHFIASFVDSSEQESIKFMMMDYAERTYFSSYTPNMFSLKNENSDIYADIFKGYKQELGNENLVVQKKQGFLGRWFGK